jgi:hypothetical protein
VQEHYLPPDNPELQDTLDAIVGECQNIFEYRKALEYCETQLSSLSKLHGDDHPRVVHMRKSANKMTERIHKFKQNQAKYTETLRSTIDDSEKAIGLLYQFNDDLSINASRINTTFNIQTTTIRKRANSLP